MEEGSSGGECSGEGDGVVAFEKRGVCGKDRERRDDGGGETVMRMR